MPKTKRVIYYVRFEWGMHNRMTKDIGPFNDYLQLTYNTLFADQDSNTLLAVFMDEGYWVLSDSLIEKFQLDKVPNETFENKFADVVIWAVAEE